MMAEMMARLLYWHDLICSWLTNIVPAWWLTHKRGWRLRVAVYVWGNAYHLSEARMMGRRRFYRCCVTGDWPEVWE